MCELQGMCFHILGHLTKWLLKCVKTMMWRCIHSAALPLLSHANFFLVTAFCKFACAERVSSTAWVRRRAVRVLSLLLAEYKIRNDGIFIIVSDVMKFFFNVFCNQKNMLYTKSVDIEEC